MSNIHPKTREAAGTLIWESPFATDTPDEVWEKFRYYANDRCVKDEDFLTFLNEAAGVLEGLGFPDLAQYVAAMARKELDELTVIVQETDLQDMISAAYAQSKDELLLEETAQQHFARWLAALPTVFAGQRVHARSFGHYRATGTEELPQVVRDAIALFSTYLAYQMRQAGLVSDAFFLQVEAQRLNSAKRHFAFSHPGSS